MFLAYSAVVRVVQLPEVVLAVAPVISTYKVWTVFLPLGRLIGNFVFIPVFLKQLTTLDTRVRTFRSQVSNPRCPALQRYVR